MSNDEFEAARYDVECCQWLCPLGRMSARGEREILEMDEMIQLK